MTFRGNLFGGSFRLTVLIALLLGIMVSAQAEVPIDKEHFPDKSFRDDIVSRYDVDGNGVLSDKELSDVKYILISGYDGIDLTGIEVFQELETLRIPNNNLETLSLPELPNLLTLVVDGNRLTSLNVSSLPALRSLKCNNNQLTSLDVSNNFLSELYCSDNQLEELDISHSTALYDLRCENNHIAGLNLEYIPLHFLYCGGNRLTELDLSHNTAIDELYCQNNQIKSLDLNLDQGLRELNCAGNQLTSLILLGDNDWPLMLYYLDCHDNSGLQELKITGADRLIAAFVSGEATEAEGVREYRSETYDAFMSVDASASVVYTLSNTASIDHTSFPDENFRKFVAETLDLDKDGGLSNWEIVNVQTLNVSGKEIADLTGIDWFTQLSTLDCSNNQLTTLDLSSNYNLYELNCAGNQLTSVNLGEQLLLQKWDFSSNPLNSLNIRGVPHMIMAVAEGKWSTDIQPAGIHLPLGVLQLPGEALAMNVGQEAFTGIKADILRISGKHYTSIGSKAFSDCPNVIIVDIHDCPDMNIAGDAFKGLGEQTYFYVGSDGGGFSYNKFWVQEVNGFKTFQDR